MWLESELHASDKPILILSHQPFAGHAVAINNWKTIQNLLRNTRTKSLHVSMVIVISMPLGKLTAFTISTRTPHRTFGWRQDQMAYYAAPLYHTDHRSQKRTLVTEESVSQWKNQSPEEIGYFDRPNHAPQAHVLTNDQPTQRSSSSTVDARISGSPYEPTPSIRIVSNFFKCPERKPHRG